MEETGWLSRWLSFPVNFRSMLKFRKAHIFSCAIFFHILVWHHLWFHNRIALGPDILYLAPVCINICIQSVAAAVAALCCYAAVVAVMLAAAVCHRVPGGKIFCRFILSDSSDVLFIFIQTRFIFNVLLGSIIACTASICLYPQ